MKKKPRNLRRNINTTISTTKRTNKRSQSMKRSQRNQKLRSTIGVKPHLLRKRKSMRLPKRLQNLLSSLRKSLRTRRKPRKLNQMIKRKIRQRRRLKRKKQWLLQQRKPRKQKQKLKRKVLIRLKLKSFQLRMISYGKIRWVEPLPSSKIRSKRLKTNIRLKWKPSKRIIKNCLKRMNPLSKSLQPPKKRRSKHLTKFKRKKSRTFSKMSTIWPLLSK